MYRYEALFDYVNPLRIESALLASGWTDLLHIAVSDAVVYVDTTGVANDLEPAFDVVRERFLAGRKRYQLALGKAVGLVDLIAVVDVDPLHAHVLISGSDKRFALLPEEHPVEWGARARELLNTGLLTEVWACVVAEVEQWVAHAREAGWTVRPDTVQGPRIVLRDDDGTDSLGFLESLYERFGHGIAPQLEPLLREHLQRLAREGDPAHA